MTFHTFIGTLILLFSLPSAASAVAAESLAAEPLRPAPYMRIATVGSDSVYVGLWPVVNYYERNLRIFANVNRIAEPGDRVLLIFGSGHDPFLRQFIA